MSRLALPLALASALLVAGCATSQRVGSGAGPAEHVVSCSWFGWYVCYDKARELCPGGYKVLSQREDWNYRKELRVACSAGG